MTIREIARETSRMLAAQRLHLSAAQFQYEFFQRVSEWPVVTDTGKSVKTTALEMAQSACQHHMKRVFEIDRELAAFQEEAENDWQERYPDDLREDTLPGGAIGQPRGCSEA